MLLSKKPTPEEYLSTKFNPAKLTINELVSILSLHGVKMQASRQQKQVYVDLFRDVLIPQGPKILSDIENVVPSSKGIQIVEHTSTSTTFKISPQKRNIASESPRSTSKRMKSLDIDRDVTAPSRLPLAKQRTPLRSRQVQRICTSTIPATDTNSNSISELKMDVFCPSKEHFNISPTLPGVRTRIVAPSAEVTLYPLIIANQVCQRPSKRIRTTCFGRNETG